MAGKSRFQFGWGKSGRRAEGLPETSGAEAGRNASSPSSPRGGDHAAGRRAERDGRRSGSDGFWGGLRDGAGASALGLLKAGAWGSAFLYAANELWNLGRWALGQPPMSFADFSGMVVGWVSGGAAADRGEERDTEVPPQPGSSGKSGQRIDPSLGIVREMAAVGRELDGLRSGRSVAETTALGRLERRGLEPAAAAAAAARGGGELGPGYVARFLLPGPERQEMRVDVSAARNDAEALRIGLDGFRAAAGGQAGPPSGTSVEIRLEEDGWLGLGSRQVRSGREYRYLAGSDFLQTSEKLASATNTWTAARAEETPEYASASYRFDLAAVASGDRNVVTARSLEEQLQGSSRIERRAVFRDGRFDSSSRPDAAFAADSVEPPGGIARALGAERNGVEVLSSREASDGSGGVTLAAAHGRMMFAVEAGGRSHVSADRVTHGWERSVSTSGSGLLTLDGGGRIRLSDRGVAAAEAVRDGVSETSALEAIARDELGAASGSVSMRLDGDASSVAMRVGRAAESGSLDVLARNGMLVLCERSRDGEVLDAAVLRDPSVTIGDAGEVRLGEKAEAMLRQALRLEKQGVVAGQGLLERVKEAWPEAGRLESYVDRAGVFSAAPAGAEASGHVGSMAAVRERAAGEVWKAGASVGGPARASLGEGVER